MYAQLALSPLFMLRVPARVVRWLAAALAAITFAVVVMISPQHPDDCHPEKHGPTQRGFSITQTLSPTTVDLFNHCPPQFNSGDFKVR
jgi:hypothetical protein